MKTIALDDFLNEGILVEKKFRQKIEQINWQKYENENVLIKGCSQAPIPTWAYLIITSNLH